nr:PepSY domain-containing protein [uncultured Acetatifactor sp.]
MKLRRKIFATVSSLAAMSTVLLTGCGSPFIEGTIPQEIVSQEAGVPGTIQQEAVPQQNVSQETIPQDVTIQEAGTIILSVNPEIQIEYNEAGLVTALTGRNAEGEGIVAGYQDFIGKECDAVLKDLVVEINEAGYFVDDIDGTKKNIVIQVEPGSVLPSADFVTNISASTQEAVQGLQLTSGIVTIDGDDYDPSYAQEGNPSPYITLDKAKEIALAQAGINAADAVFAERDFDHDDGTATFELEFTANGNVYDYEVDAQTGKVIKAEQRAVVPAPQTQSGTGATTPQTQSGTGATTPQTQSGTGATTPQTQSGTSATTPQTQSGTGAATVPPATNIPANYNDTDYGPNSDGVTDYNDTDYGPNSDGVTDYNDTDYGPNSDGVTDYNDTDYGPNNDGVTDYSQAGSSNYNDNGNTNYNDGGNSNYDD